MERHEYVEVNNAEIVPEVCNEFVTILIEGRKSLPDN